MVSFLLSVVLVLVVMFVFLVLYVSRPYQIPELSATNLYTGDGIPESYDYIVVGAGSAGCVLAARLAQGKNSSGELNSVLLLEAGPTSHKDPFVVAPLNWLRALFTNVDWNHSYAPQAGLLGRALHLMRGKLLGGCSSVNAMMWVRGSREDYDLWEKSGNPGWGWQDVLPAFKSIESFPEGDPEVRGHDGPIKIRAVESPAVGLFVESAVAAGFPRAKDHNGVDRRGVAFNQQNNAKGERFDAFSAFVEAEIEKGNGNLTVVANALVHRVVFSKERHAEEVEVCVNGTMRTFKAIREIVLCGGAINSPQTLMLSGIGPKDHLKDLGIPLVQDSPVGNNLHDHIGISVPFKFTQSVGPNDGGSGLNGIGFYQSEWAKENTPDLAEDMQLVPFVGKVFETIGPLTLTEKLVGIRLNGLAGNRTRNVAAMVRPLFQEGGLLHNEVMRNYAVNAGLQQPTSRGTLRLVSKSPDDVPIANPNFLQTREDIARLVEGFKIVRRIIHSGPFKEKGADEFLTRELVADDDIEQFVREKANHWWHPVGTCKMAPGEDGVVDHELRVKGVTGLRVADASIMPFVPSGNTNWPAMMVGARAAQIILSSNAAN